MSAKKGTILGATLLVAGTCIGGGMLALPVATCKAGFFPSLVMMLFGWAFMTTTALFLSEINLWMEKGSHVVSMASRFLGPVGKVLAWLLYLFISYASLVAYTAGGGELFRSGLEAIGIYLPQNVVVLLFVLLFGSILYLGNLVLGRINTILMFGLVISYLLLLGTGTGHISLDPLMRSDWGNTLIAVPLLLTIFSFQTIVPSLTIYLHQDGKALRRSILYGTVMSFIVYALWQWLVLGTVLYDGENGLAAALEQGLPATQFLRSATGNPWIGAFANFFAFFALITSFLGIALGLFDFLADGFKIKRNKVGNLLLGLLVAVPILFFVFTYKRVFLSALDSSGGIGDSILNGMMPASMLWIGRYKMKLSSEYQIPGGKPFIVCVFAYAVFVFIIEILGKCGVIFSL